MHVPASLCCLHGQVKACLARRWYKLFHFAGAASRKGRQLGIGEDSRNATLLVFSTSRASDGAVTLCDSDISLVRCFAFPAVQPGEESVRKTLVSQTAANSCLVQ